MADIFTDAFWTEQGDSLYNKTARLLFEVYYAGGLSGEKQLPKNARVLLDWDVFNQQAIDHLSRYKLETIRGVTDFTRRRAMATVSEWIQSGEPLPNLVTKLNTYFGPTRARRIAVTEVTRTYAAGNQAAWETTGMVSAKVWRTANDELVCPICGPMNGKVVELDADFSLTQDEIAAWGDKNKIAIPRNFMNTSAKYPPMHVNCRCYIAPVVSREMVRSKIRESLFNGDLRLTVDMLVNHGSYYTIPLSLLKAYWTEGGER